MVLQATGDQCTRETLEKVMLYISLSIRILSALDEFNTEPDILSLLDAFIADPADQSFLHREIQENAKEAVETIKKKTSRIKIIKIDNKTTRYLTTEPLCFNVSVANFGINTIYAQLQVRAPGTEYDRDLLKIKLGPYQRRECDFNLGKPRSYGKFLIFFDVLDYEGNLEETRRFNWYIPPPEENLRFESINLENSELMEDMDLPIRITISNKEATREECKILVESSAFDGLEKTPTFVINGKNQLDQQIVVKKARMSKDPSMTIVLLHKETDRICETRRFELKIKRSWGKILKNTAGKILNIAKLIK
nr:hypothetical protein [Candidatus Sigynarchaeota archaeon]